MENFIDWDDRNTKWDFIGAITGQRYYLEILRPDNGVIDNILRQTSEFTVACN